MTRQSLTIGAVIPNYNYARFLADRIASIQAQSRPVQHLVFLDDGSTDDSWSVAAPLLAALGCPVQTRRSAANGGNVLRQWQAGAALLETDLAWIAEADDSAEPGLLAALAARLEADPEARFAFCDSIGIDAEGAILAEHGKEYLGGLGDTALEQDGQFPAPAFAARFLYPRNMVVSASAVLWRRSALLAALRALEREVDDWRCAGDWRVYAEACAEGRAAAASIHYLATPLSRHRRHGRSVTGGAAPAAHFAEVVAMLALLRRRLGPAAASDALARRHLATLRARWGLDTPADQG